MSEPGVEQPQTEKKEDTFNEEVDDVATSGKGCCNFGGNDVAKGFNLIGIGRGPIVMSNVFLSGALLYLASEEVGCVEEVFDQETNTTSMEIIEDCDEQVYGAFKPAALITNIAVISGLLSALLMPVIGAIVDYTPHRWMVGVVSAIFIILIQGIQIGTGSSTWFAMAILQAIVGFIYNVQVLSTFAYLPDVSRVVGERKMTLYTSKFTMAQFGSQAIFLVVVVALSMAFGWGDVMIGRASQAVNTVWIMVSFYLGWKFLPKVKSRNTLPQGKSLLLQGFRQNWTTAKRIQRHFKKGLRWFLLATMFGEATTNGFIVVSIVFLQDKLGLSSSESGIFFLLSIVAMIPGGELASFVTSKTNPNTSLRLSLSCLFGLGIFGGLVLTPDNAWPIAYVWAVLAGLTMGWFYPTENLFFSLVIPQNREAELSGFFVYCTQILSWLPPLIFSILVENNIEQGIGVIAVTSFSLVAIVLLSMSSSWPEIVEDVRKHDSQDFMLSGEIAVPNINPLEDAQNINDEEMSSPTVGSLGSKEAK